MDLPYLTADLPGTGGALRTVESDFIVDEVPAYLPSGSGDHVFVRIEKRGLTTPQAVERLARAHGVQPRDVGVAGMKDRHAITRQWLSLPPPVKPEDVRPVEGVEILEVARHGHKLRTGHVRANKFVLRVRGASDANRARAILERLTQAPGAPNWYGEQRFGREGDNAQRGFEILRGGQPPRDKKLARLLVSSLQSKLFNDWLTDRMRDGLYTRVLAGDICHKRDGGMFTCEDPKTDEARLHAGELCVTGPMYGDRMRRPPDGTTTAEREDAILAGAALKRDSWKVVAAIAEGTRRDATIEVKDIGVDQVEPDVLEVRFTLPGGAYATAVMREVMKTA